LFSKSFISFLSLFYDLFLGGKCHGKTERSDVELGTEAGTRTSPAAKGK
jgi:hypothetical protein